MSPEQLRDKAKELLGRAKKASNPKVKDALLEQARALDAQARAVDRDAFVE